MNEIYKRIFTALILFTLFIFCLFFNQFTWQLFISFFLIISFYEFINLINKIYKKKIFKILILAIIAFFLFLNLIILSNTRLEFGEELILTLFIACIASDIGGYISGKTIGGPKLTKISPKKTIAGAIGSIFFTIIITSFFIKFYDNKLYTLIDLEFTNPIKKYLWLIFMSILCQLGDLFISYLKRKADVKDTGVMLPGHGGVLDRIDGIIIAIPIGIFLFF